MRHRYAIYSLFWVTFPRSHVIDRSKVADVVVVVISTRICFVEREESLGFFWRAKNHRSKKAGKTKTRSMWNTKAFKKREHRTIFTGMQNIFLCFFCIFTFFQGSHFLGSSSCSLAFINSSTNN